jgi:hypothetical protein
MSDDDFYGWSFHWFPNILRNFNVGWGIWWYDKNGRWRSKERRFYGFSLSLGPLHIEYRRKAAYEVSPQ